MKFVQFKSKEGDIFALNLDYLIKVIPSSDGVHHPFAKILYRNGAGTSVVTLTYSYFTVLELIREAESS